MLCYSTGTAYILAAKTAIIPGNKSYPCPISSARWDGRQPGCSLFHICLSRQEAFIFSPCKYGRGETPTLSVFSGISHQGSRGQ